MTQPLVYVGHPDFVPTNSTPVPTFAAEVGTFPVGTWGPVTVNVTSGGAYLIAVSPLVTTDVVATDVTIKHLDFNGNVVYQEFFGAVLAGNAFNGGIETTAPTIIRGNIYGSQLVISGQCATSAYMNTIIPGAGMTATSAVVNLYLLPSGIGDPDPKLSNGSAEISGITGSTPGGLLLTFDNVSVAPSTAEGPTILAPYTGAAILTLLINPPYTTPGNLVGLLYSYTVANGTSSVARTTIQVTAVSELFEYDINIPACLTTLEYINNSGAQSAEFSSNIVAVRTA